MAIIKKKLCNPKEIPIEQLHPFQNHPYKVLDNEEMETLTESIRAEGILSPLIVRPIDGTEEYAVISGHRRLYAAQKAGLSNVPAFVYEMNREEAAILLVDSNLHREHILPSEKAFAYKLKMNALSHQGTSRQIGDKLSVTKISEAGTDSERQVHRYIRLTELSPELLQLVDNGRIALTPAVELSYLSQDEQAALLETIQSEDATPSLSQAQQMRKLSQFGKLDADQVLQIMCQPKSNQVEKISLNYGQLRKFFPKSYTPKEIQAVILKLVEADYKRRQRAMER